MEAMKSVFYFNVSIAVQYSHTDIKRFARHIVIVVRMWLLKASVCASKSMKS